MGRDTSGCRRGFAAFAWPAFFGVARGSGAAQDSSTGARALVVHYVAGL